MDRRSFISSSIAASSLAAISAKAYAAADNAPRRVGLIGAGWYGKCDLLQLMNVERLKSYRYAMSIRRCSIPQQA